MEALDAILAGIADVLSSVYGYKARVGPQPSLSTIVISREKDSFDPTPHIAEYTVRFQFNQEGFLEIDRAGLNNKICFFDLSDPETTVEILAEAVHSLCPRKWKLDNFWYK